MKENRKKREGREQTLVIVVLLFMLVLLVVGVTYAAFTYSKQGTKINQISTATMTMNYIEGTKGIVINNSMPVTEDVGKQLSGENETYDFSVEVGITGQQALIYEIVASKDNTRSTIKNENVRLYLQSGSSPNSYTKEVLQPTQYTPLAAKDDLDVSAGDMVLARVGATSSMTTHYRLRMWIDSSYVVGSTSGEFYITVDVYGKDATIAEAQALQ